MTLFRRALLAAGIMLAPAVPAQAPAQTPENRPIYVVTYIEVAPSAKAEAASLLKQIAAASRTEPGNLRYDILQRLGRDNQFVILEGWGDSKAAQSHAGGAAMTQFRDRLKPLRIGHYDERPSIEVAAAMAKTPIAKGSIFTITHVDVTPVFTNQCIAMMKKLTEETRKEASFEEFEAWQQTAHPNHFTMTAIWKDRAAVEAHGLGAPAKEFREEIGPMIGALYDERFYTGIE